MLLSVSYVTLSGWEYMDTKDNTYSVGLLSDFIFNVDWHDAEYHVFIQHMYLYRDTMNVMQKMIDKGYLCKHCTVWMSLFKTLHFDNICACRSRSNDT